jgi:hypothetical protein
VATAPASWKLPNAGRPAKSRCRKRHHRNRANNNQQDANTQVCAALDYLGLPREMGVMASAAIIIAAAGTGDFRRFERFALLLVFESLLLIPVFLWVHPPIGEIVCMTWWSRSFRRTASSAR